jgi:hypothetical protein
MKLTLPKYLTFLPKKINIVFYLLFIIFLFNTCKKDEECPPIRDEYFMFYRDALRNIKYNEHDTLIFESEKGDQFTFIGTGQIDSGYSVRWAETSGDCRYLRKNEKYYNMVFKSKDYKSDLIASVFYTRELLFFGFSIYNADYYIYNDKIYEGEYKIYKDLFKSNIFYIDYSLKEGITQINFPDGSKLTKLK